MDDTERELEIESKCSSLLRDLFLCKIDKLSKRRQMLAELEEDLKHKINKFEKFRK